MNVRVEFTATNEFEVQQLANFMASLNVPQAIKEGEAYVVHQVAVQPTTAPAPAPTPVVETVAAPVELTPAQQTCKSPSEPEANSVHSDVEVATLEMCKAKAIELIRKNKKNEMEAVVNKYGSKLPELTPDQLNQVYAGFKLIV